MFSIFIFPIFAQISWSSFIIIAQQTAQKHEFSIVPAKSAVYDWASPSYVCNSLTRVVSCSVGVSFFNTSITLHSTRSTVTHAGGFAPRSPPGFLRKLPWAGKPALGWKPPGFSRRAKALAGDHSPGTPVGKERVGQAPLLAS